MKTIKITRLKIKVADTSRGGNYLEISFPDLKDWDLPAFGTWFRVVARSSGNAVAFNHLVNRIKCCALDAALKWLADEKKSLARISLEITGEQAVVELDADHIEIDLVPVDRVINTGFSFNPGSS